MDLHRSLLYHVTLTALDDFRRSDPKWTPLDGLEFMPTASSSESTKKKFQQVWVKAVGLVVSSTAHQQVSVSLSRNDEEDVARERALYHCDEFGTYCLSVLHRITEVMSLVVVRVELGASWCDGIDGRSRSLGPRIDVVEFEALCSTRSVS